MEKEKPLSLNELELTARYFTALRCLNEPKEENEHLDKTTACSMPIEEGYVKQLRKVVKMQGIDTSEMNDAEVVEKARYVLIEILNSVIKYMNNEVYPYIVDFLASVADWYGELPEETQETLSK